MAVGVTGDQAADVDAFGRLGHRGLKGPPFPNRTVRAGGSDRGEVIEVPEVVEAGLVGDLPDRAQLLDRDPLT